MEKRKYTIMYTNYQGNLLSDEPSNLTPYPIHLFVDENRNLVVIPTPTLGDNVAEGLDGKGADLIIEE